MYKEPRCVIRTIKEGYEVDITTNTPLALREICDHRIFESMAQFDLLTMIASKGAAAYERGLACPADTKNAIKKIQSMDKF